MLFSIGPCTIQKVKSYGQSGNDQMKIAAENLECTGIPSKTKVRARRKKR